MFDSNTGLHMCICRYRGVLYTNRYSQSAANAVLYVPHMAGQERVAMRLVQLTLTWAAACSAFTSAARARASPACSLDAAARSASYVQCPKQQEHGHMLASDWVTKGECMAVNGVHCGVL